MIEDLPEASNMLQNGFGTDQDVEEGLVQRGGLVRTVDNIDRDPGKNKIVLGGRTNSLRGARSTGNGVITDEIYTYNGPIIISTYGRCKRRPLWGCREVSPRGPPRGSLVEVATHHVTAITDRDQGSTE